MGVAVAVGGSAWVNEGDKGNLASRQESCCLSKLHYSGVHPVRDVVTVADLPAPRAAAQPALQEAAVVL